MTCGVYIHVPFCRRKCDYCGFYSFAGLLDPDGRVPAAYIERLDKEIGERLPAAGVSSADTVYFGGGTPSLCSIDDIARLLDRINGLAGILPGAEVTLEMNPDDVSAPLLAGLRDAGVTRVVLGIQTLSARLGALIGRSSGPCTEQELDTFFSARGLELCADLIGGIPTQRVEELLYDIDTVAGYRPKHISAYLLSIEKKTPLGARVTPDNGFEAEQAELFEVMMTGLAGHGYVQYEISNYALPGFESRHNMKYWRFDPYIGFGPGAHSFIGGERYVNAMGLDDYIRSEQTAVVRDERTARAAPVEYLMTGLRLMRGVSLLEMEERLAFQVPAAVMERIESAASAGLAAIGGSGNDVTVRLTRRGVLLADAVIYGIVEALL